MDNNRAQNMKPILPSLMAVGLLGTCAAIVTASAQMQQRDDWRFYDATGNWAATHKTVDLLYLASEIRHVPGGKIQVWSEALDSHAVDNIRLNRASIQRIAKKLEVYSPPYGRLHKLTSMEKASIVGIEEIADRGELQAVTKALMELDCANEQYQLIYSLNFKGGQPHVLSVPSGWLYIPPDSVIADLATLVCPAQ